MSVFLNRIFRCRSVMVLPPEVSTAVERVGRRDIAKGLTGDAAYGARVVGGVPLFVALNLLLCLSRHQT